jgi:anti-sigma factor RsiW
MNARTHDQGSDGQMNRAQEFEPHVQDYVEGTLDAKQALRLHLRAQADPVIAEELARTRAFFAALDAMPREEPPVDFDARVLASVPFEYYRSAPQRPATVLVLGDLAPAAWWVALRRAGRGAMATAAAYVLALVVANSALRDLATSFAASIDRMLDAAVQGTASNPALSGLVSGLERAYDAATTITVRLAEVIGPSTLVFAVGGLVGLVALAGLTAHQRRTLEGPRT